MKNGDLARNIIYSQAALYLTLLICVLLSPASLSANSGFSYFGHHRLTVVPFAAGFFISAYYLWRARENLRNSADYQILHKGLAVIIPGMVIIVLAPAVGSGLLDVIHRIFGSIVFITELILGWWMASKLRSDPISWLFLGLQFLGGVIAAYYLSPPTGYSFEGQLLFQVAFSALLSRALLSKKSPNVKEEK